MHDAREILTQVDGVPTLAAAVSDDRRARRGLFALDFSARAGGRSPGGIAFQPRSTAGSFARTVHYFRKVSGTAFWPGGIAYDGDLSVYPEFAAETG